MVHFCCATRGESRRSSAECARTKCRSKITTFSGITRMTIMLLQPVAAWSSFYRALTIIPRASSRACDRIESRVCHRSSYLRRRQVVHINNLYRSEIVYTARNITQHVRRYLHHNDRGPVSAVMCTHHCRGIAGVGRDKFTS